MAKNEVKSEVETSKPDPRLARKVEMLGSVSLLSGSFAPKQIVGVTAEVSVVQQEQWVKQGLAKFVGESTPVTPETAGPRVTIDDVGGPPPIKPVTPVKRKPSAKKEE